VVAVGEGEGGDDWRKGRVTTAAMGESRGGDDGGRRGGGRRRERAEEAATTVKVIGFLIFSQHGFEPTA
jgi:hypothetical protein